MTVAQRAIGAGAAALLFAQGLISLALRPSAGKTYGGTTADIVNETVFAAGLVMLGMFLLIASTDAAIDRAASAVTATGCALLAASTIVTVLAGEERWDLAFIAGFALAEIGLVVSMLLQRSLAFAASVLGLVLVLAFFDTAGGLAFGLAVALVVRDRSAAVQSSRPVGV